MRKPLAILFAAIFALWTALVPAGVHAVTLPGSSHSVDPGSFVDPFIGTTGSVDDFPGADAPFGMVQWSPDTPTRPSGGGYDYHDATITGFSLDHLSGPGCAALGDVPILPWVGSIPTAGSGPSGLSQPFLHTSEQAWPGYYSVVLEQPGQPLGITTQLTVTPRSGLGEFTFPSSSQSNLLFNLAGSAAGTIDSSAQIVGNDTVSGWVESGHFCGAGDVYRLYFSITFDHPFASGGVWDGSTLNPGATSASGSSSGLYVTFDTTSNPTVLAKVGVSFVSVANAQANAQTEDPGWDFAGLWQHTYQSWDDLLSKIAVTGGTQDEQTIFYTALYHSLLHPNIFSDVNGQYMGFDNQVHTAPSGHAQYANFSGWDIYRSQVQLLALVDPTVGSDVAQSMVNDYQQGGLLPKWALNNAETYIMVGDPADGMLAGLYAFGARSFDTGAALRAMIAQATQPNTNRPGLDYYQSLHYEPDNGAYGCCNWYGSVSTTQEYALADGAIAQLAGALGDTADQQTFAQRSQNWQYLFDVTHNLVRAKELNGQFITPFIPNRSTIISSVNNPVYGGYVEGDAYQYTPLEPQNLQGLITAMGGNAAYVKYLDRLFAPYGGPDAPLAYASNEAMTQSAFGGMMVPFTWQGNEPATEIPWEYDWAGASYRTQDVVRRIALNIYTTRPDGLPGNDDLGEMSSWYVWAALGMYPEIPGSAYLALGSPLFTSETITLGSGKTLSISAPAASDTNRYIQSMTLNGQPWSNAYLPPSVVQNGGSITVALGSSPNTSWATAASSAPPSYSAGELPAIPFTRPSALIPSAPAPTPGYPVTVGARNETAQQQTIDWSASPTNGAAVTPSSGTITVPPGGMGKVSTSVSAPAGTTSAMVTFSFTTASGTALPPVIDQIGGSATAGCTTVPAEPVGVDTNAPYYNSAGISDDCNDLGDLDFLGSSYSEEALTAAGLAPGTAVNWNGFSFHWPNVGPGEPDNTMPMGQTIPIAAASGAGALGFLGSSNNGPVQVSATVTYSDGTQQTISIGFSDWTLGAGSGQPDFGNSIIATMPYYNTLGGMQNTTNYVFATQVSLLPGKTPVSLTLPTPTIQQSQIHIFAMAAH